MAYQPCAELTPRWPFVDTGRLVIIRRKLPSDRVTVDCGKAFLLFTADLRRQLANDRCYFFLISGDELTFFVVALHRKLTLRIFFANTCNMVTTNSHLGRQ